MNESVRTCAGCGGSLEADARFCPRCGRDATGGVGASSVGGVSGRILDRLAAQLSRSHRIKRPLGRGGMSYVYLAREELLDRWVAIKVLAPHLADEPTVVDRFLREARTQAALNHPNIVNIHTVSGGEPGDLHFIIMEYMPGRTLGEIVRAADGAVDVTIALTWLTQVGGALQHAHQQEIIHRDIKPGNILFDSHGNAHVADFGIAKLEHLPRLTQVGMVVGTPTYMSPEQFLGEEVGAASDQYSLGVVAFEMLTGKVPFKGSDLELYRAHREDVPPAVRELRPDIPGSVSQAVARMLAKEPKDRFPSIGEAVSALGGRLPGPGDPMVRVMAALTTQPLEVRIEADQEVTLETGARLSLAAVACDAEGTPLPGRRIEWQSGDPDVVDVTPEGLVVGRGEGTATIKAVCEGAVATRTVTVVRARGAAAPPETRTPPEPWQQPPRDPGPPTPGPRPPADTPPTWEAPPAPDTPDKPTPPAPTPTPPPAGATPDAPPSRDPTPPPAADTGQDPAPGSTTGPATGPSTGPSTGPGQWGQWDTGQDRAADRPADPSTGPSQWGVGQDDVAGPATGPSTGPGQWDTGQDDVAGRPLDASTPSDPTPAPEGAPAGGRRRVAIWASVLGVGTLAVVAVSWVLLSGGSAALDGGPGAEGEGGPGTAADAETLVERATLRVDGGELPAGASLVLQGADSTIEIDPDRNVDVPPGRYVLQASAPGFQPFQQEVELAAGEGETLTGLALEATPPSSGRLVLQGAPGGARVTVRGGGQSWSVPPTGRLDLPPGDYVLEATAAGFTSLRRTFSVRPDQDTSLPIAMERVAEPEPEEDEPEVEPEPRDPVDEPVQPGTLRVSGALPQGGTLRLEGPDGARDLAVGTTSLPPGSYTVRASAPGRQPTDLSVTVRAGQEATVAIPDLPLSDQARAAALQAVDGVVARFDSREVAVADLLDEPERERYRALLSNRSVSDFSATLLEVDRPPAPGGGGITAGFRMRINFTSANIRADQELAMIAHLEERNGDQVVVRLETVR